MFDKKKFSEILTSLCKNYYNQRDFAASVGVNRGYLSQYMNQKLSSPPSPKILKRISDSSNGSVSYDELMQICGYTNTTEQNYVKAALEFSDNKSKKIMVDALGMLLSNKLSVDELGHYIDNKNTNYKESIYRVVIYLYNLLSTEYNIKVEYTADKLEDLKNNLIKRLIYGNDNKTDNIDNQTKAVPLLGTVRAGYDYLAEENWIGTVDVDANLIKDGEQYFALKVCGDSMAPVLLENDIVIVKKQHDFESGDIVVALINGNEATIKKGKKTNNSILLQPLNTSYEPLIFTKNEMKTIPVQIIGVVKQMKRNF